jgi:hypothetical protein
MNPDQFNKLTAAIATLESLASDAVLVRSAIVQLRSHRESVMTELAAKAAAAKAEEAAKTAEAVAASAESAAN